MATEILTVVGARPQFVKASVVSSALAALGRHEAIIHTGQHYDHAMSGAFFRDLNIPEPVVDLGISGGSHAAMTAAMLVALADEMERRAPALVLLYGDTNSTLAGALAAAKLGLPIAHVEAGPRMGNREHPEETNRILVDHLADLLLVPTDLCADNLRREGLGARVRVVGDTQLDALRAHAPLAVPPGLEGDFVVATVHRAQNTDQPQRLAAIMAGLALCPYPVVLPLHPRTAEAMARHGLATPANTRVLPPQGYLEMLGLMAGCRFAITDSGGVPKEAFYLGRRSLTISSETPWPELAMADATRVVGCDLALWRDGLVWADRPLDPVDNPFGDGRTGQRIAGIIAAFLDEMP